MFAYASIEHKYDHLVGKTCRGSNLKILGTIVDVVYEVDGYGHENAWAVLDGKLDDFIYAYLESIQAQRDN